MAVARKREKYIDDYMECCLLVYWNVVRSARSFSRDGVLSRITGEAALGSRSTGGPARNGVLCLLATARSGLFFDRVLSCFTLQVPRVLLGHWG